MMSGGVDSSTVAFLLSKNKKYEVFGSFIKGYNIDGCQEKEAEDARRVAEFLNIPFYVINLEEEYRKLVVDYMIKGYKNGITPNPDVMCNKEIKFGLFLKKALELGADYVATGHYVRLSRKTSNSKHQISNKVELPIVNYQLIIAKDKNKDQSYFLWTLTQDQLKHCLFPIGEYTKPEIRKIAAKANLPTAGKKDSQGICFLGKISIKEFLKQHLPVEKGNIIDVNGKKIGKHDGAWFYTIGQRHGLDIGERNKGQGIKNSNFKPYYVVGKNVKKNLIIVAEGEKNPELCKKEIEISDCNFNPLLFGLKRFPDEIYVRIRYRQVLAPAFLHSLSSGKYGINFEKPQKFVAPGQSAVFYDKNGKMLGGGIICS